MEEIQIPRLLDEKERVLFLHMYEVVVLIGGIGFGIVLKIPLIGVLIGFALFGLCRRLKSKGLLDIIGILLYWYLPAGMLAFLRIKLEGTPPNYLTRFSG